MFRFILSLIVLGLFACGESHSDHDHTPTADTSVSDTAAPKTIKVTYTAVNAQTDEAIPGAEICVDGQDCLVSDDAGVVELELVVGTRIDVSAKAAGFTTARGSAIVADNAVTEFSLPLILEVVVTLLANQAGAETVDPERGHIAFLSVYPGDDVVGEKSGVSLTINPAGDGIGPKYVKDGDIIELLAEDLYDDTLTATTSSGAVNYFNLTPGDYSLSVSGAEGCTSFFGVENADGTIGFDVKANEITYLLYTCAAE